MTKNLKLMLIAFMLMLPCSMVFAQDDPDDGEEIELRTGPKLAGNPGPSRAPARRFSMTLSAFLQQANFQLLVNDTAGKTYSYCIYDEDEAVVSQGTLDFSDCESLYINLIGLEEGEYTLEFYDGSRSYIGTFYL